MRFTTELVAIELSPRRFLRQQQAQFGRKTTFMNDRKFEQMLAHLVFSFTLTSSWCSSPPSGASPRRA